MYHKRGICIQNDEFCRAGSADDVVLKLRGNKIANMDGWFGKSDPFIAIHRQVAGQWV